jgi:hypothetical protein
MNGNSKEELKALAATGVGATGASACGASVGGMGLTALGKGIAALGLGVGTAIDAVGGFSAFDCTICSKRHKVFRPTQSAAS